MPSSRRTPQWKFSVRGGRGRTGLLLWSLHLYADGAFGCRCGGVVNSTAWVLDAGVASLLRLIWGMLLQRRIGSWAVGFTVGWNSEREGVGEIKADESFR